MSVLTWEDIIPASGTVDESTETGHSQWCLESRGGYVAVPICRQVSQILACRCLVPLFDVLLWQDGGEVVADRRCSSWPNGCKMCTAVVCNVFIVQVSTAVRVRRPRS